MANGSTDARALIGSNPANTWNTSCCARSEETPARLGFRKTSRQKVFNTMQESYHDHNVTPRMAPEEQQSIAHGPGLVQSLEPVLWEVLEVQKMGHHLLIAKAV